MSIGDVSLSSATRANLSALQNTSKLLQSTQKQLATGKKVNSSLDDASAYFASQGFLNSANDLSSLKDSMSTAIQTVQSATDAIDSVETVITQMQGLVNSALQTTDATSLAGYAGQYNSLRTQLDGLVSDSTFNGTNLLNSTTTTLSVYFNSTNTTSLAISAVNVTSAGLSIATAANAWAATADVKAAQSLLQTALSTLRTDAASFGNNNTILNTRSDFTSNMVSTLQTASDNLTLADTNEEGANMQTLQAQSQLGIVALSISGTQASAILKLF